MATSEEIKKHERESYDAIAEQFDAVWARYTGRFAGDMIDSVFPQLGETALDLAGGTGAAGLKLAERLGPTGKVEIVDLSPGMLCVAAKNAAVRNLTNVTTHEMDAEQLQFPDRVFDLITCSFGIMFCPNTGRALAEASRVLKPGGRIGFTVWGDPLHAPLFSHTAEAMIRRMAPAIVRDFLEVPLFHTPLLRWIMTHRGAVGPSAFRFARRGSLEKQLARVGFQQIRREPRSYPIEFEKFEDYWSAYLNGTVSGSMAARRFSRDELTEIATEVRAKLVNAKGSVYVHNEAAIILGHKPV